MLNKEIVIINVLYRGMNIFIIFFINILLSRLAGVGGYGMLSLMITNAGIFNLLSGLGADSGLTFHVASGKIRVTKLLSFLEYVLLFQLLILIITEAISFSFTGHFFIFRSINLREGLLGVLFLLSVSVTEKYSALLAGKQRFKLVSKILLVSNIFTLVFFAFLYFIPIDHSVTFYIGAYIIFNLFQSLLLILAFHIGDKNPAKAENAGASEVKLFFSYSFFTFIINIIQFLAYRIDYWLLDFYKGNEQLGWYSLSVRLAQLFWIIPLLLAGIVFPIVAKQKKTYNEKLIPVIIRLMNIFNVIGSVCLYFLTPILLPFLFGEEYSNSISLFQLLLPGVLMFCNTTILASYFGGKGKLWVNFWGSLLCLLVILALDMVLIPESGMKGAAIASTIGYAVTGIYSLTVYSCLEKISLIKLLVPQRSDWNTIYSIIKNK